MNKKIKQIKKDIVAECPACLRSYQLLEIHYRDKEFADTKCLLNCLNKWQQILQDYHNEEIKKEDKITKEFLKNLTKKEKK